MPNPTPKHPPVKLTKGVIDRLKPGPKDQFIWDAQDKGFAAKISPAGKISFLVQARLTPTSNPIRISVGDKVNVQMSPYDLGKARITFRHA